MQNEYGKRILCVFASEPHSLGLISEHTRGDRFDEHLPIQNLCFIRLPRLFLDLSHTWPSFLKRLRGITQLKTTSGAHQMTRFAVFGRAHEVVQFGAALCLHAGQLERYHTPLIPYLRHGLLILTPFYVLILHNRPPPLPARLRQFVKLIKRGRVVLEQFDFAVKGQTALLLEYVQAFLSRLLLIDLQRGHLPPTLHFLLAWQ